MAYKYCTKDGKWENVTNFFGTTDYSSCYTPELTDTLKKLGSDNDTKVPKLSTIIHICQKYFRLTLIIFSSENLK